MQVITEEGGSPVGPVNAIKVSVRPPTAAGRLHPRYDRESDILAVESSVPRAWPHGIDIDGNVVFDLDQRRVLANFDLHIPMSCWLRDLETGWPASVEPGDLCFSPETVLEKSFNLPLRVRTDVDARQVRIEIGFDEPTGAVELSDRCIALLAGDSLVGFLVRDVDE